MGREGEGVLVGPQVVQDRDSVSWVPGRDLDTEADPMRKWGQANPSCHPHEIAGIAHPMLAHTDPREEIKTSPTPGAARAPPLHGLASSGAEGEPRDGCSSLERARRSHRALQAAGHCPTVLPPRRKSLRNRRD